MTQSSSMSNRSSPSRAVRMASHHRVLLYTTCYNVLDGVTLTVRKLEEEILAAGHSVCVLTTVSGDPAKTNLVPEHPNRRVIFLDNSRPIPFVQDPNNPEHVYQLGFGLSSRVRRQLDEFEPSIIHLTCPDCTALHLIEYARQKELPIMGTYHSNIPEYMEHYRGMSWLKHILSAWIRHQSNFLLAVYTPTPFIQRHLTNAYQFDRVTDLQVWGHGVDVDKFHPSHRSLKFRRNLGIGDHEVVIVWVSRLVPEKRPDIFGQVVKRLHARNLPFHALVIGAGQCEEEIKALPNTTFAGWFNEEQLSVAYASSDIFLFPSAVETFGLVTLEAAASGLPVVVESGCSGHLVAHGESGYACPAGDTEAFYQATLELVVDHDKRRRFSEASRHLSLAWEKRVIVRRMIDNYAKVEECFFTEYGGRHANRDLAYDKPDSFTAGNHPRPTLLVAVEWLFIALFQFIWNMTSVFVYIQQTLLSRGRFAPVPVHEAPTPLPITKKPMQRSSTRELSHVPSSSMSEFSDIDMDDDGTDSTASLSSDPESIAAGYFCPTGDQAFGDCGLAHSMSKGFVSAMRVQCRTESRLRNAVTLCCGGQALTRTSAKRKNSSMAIEVPEMMRVRSDASETEPMMGSHRMRRTPSLMDV